MLLCKYAPFSSTVLEDHIKITNDNKAELVQNQNDTLKLKKLTNHPMRATNYSKFNGTTETAFQLVECNTKFF